MHHEKQVYAAPVTTCKSERKESPLAKSSSRGTGKGKRSLWVNTRSSIMGENERRCEADHRPGAGNDPPGPAAHPAWRKLFPAKPHLSSSLPAREIVGKWKPVPNYEAIRRKVTPILAASFPEALFASHCSYRSGKKIMQSRRAGGPDKCWGHVTQ